MVVILKKLQLFEMLFVNDELSLRRHLETR